MDPSSWKQVLNALDLISPRKRFSALKPNELQDIWKEMALVVSNQMVNRKICINVSCLGRFIMGHPSPLEGDVESFVPHFVPSRDLLKLSKFHPVKYNLTEIPPTEMINYSSLASKTPFTRDQVELGLKDVTLGMHRAVNEANSGSFLLPSLGKLYFRNGKIRLKYSRSFVDALNAPPLEQRNEYSCDHIEQEAKRQSFELQKINLKSLSKEPTRNVPPLEAASHAPEAERANSPTQLLVSINDDSRGPKNLTETLAVIRVTNERNNQPPRITNADPSRSPSDDLIHALQSTSLASDLSLPFIAAEVEQARKKADAWKVRNPAVVEPQEGMHFHSNSGNRLWQDGKCPVCRAKALRFVDLKKEGEWREKEFDRMVVRLSMEIDQQMAQKEKVLKINKAKDAAEAAQHNWKTILQKEEERKAALKALRTQVAKSKTELKPQLHRPEDLLLADHLKHQIENHKAQRYRLRYEKEQEDKLLNEECIAEVKADQLRKFTENLRKQQLQREALKSQIDVQRQRRERAQVASSFPLENTFVENSNPAIPFPIADTKTIMQDQMNSARQTREKRRQAKEEEKMRSMTLLGITRDELDQDLLNLRREKWEARKTLETFWRDQEFWKQKLAAAYH